MCVCVFCCKITRISCSFWYQPLIGYMVYRQFLLLCRSFLCCRKMDILKERCEMQKHIQVFIAWLLLLSGCSWLFQNIAEASLQSLADKVLVICPFHRSYSVLQDSDFQTGAGRIPGGLVKTRIGETLSQSSWFSRRVRPKKFCQKQVVLVLPTWNLCFENHCFKKKKIAFTKTTGIQLLAYLFTVSFSNISF